MHEGASTFLSFSFWPRFKFATAGSWTARQTLEIPEWIRTTSCTSSPIPTAFQLDTSLLETNVSNYRDILSSLYPTGSVQWIYPSTGSTVFPSLPASVSAPLFSLCLVMLRVGGETYDILIWETLSQYKPIICRYGKLQCMVIAPWSLALHSWPAAAMKNRAWMLSLGWMID